MSAVDRLSGVLLAGATIAGVVWGSACRMPSHPGTDACGQESVKRRPERAEDAKRKR